VRAFPGSARRPMIYAAYVEHAEEALSLIAAEPREQWMDGSFTTAKPEPGDVDFVTFVPRAALNALTPPQRLRAWELFDGGPHGRSCHAFVVPVPERGSPEEEEAYRMQRRLWSVLFGQQRREDGGHPKGIVRLRVGGSR
jgi:hypothetical protein